MAPLRRHGEALMRAHSFAFDRGRALPSLSFARSLSAWGSSGMSLAAPDLRMRVEKCRAFPEGRSP
jgi:hypothetical protein